jgi:tight adherence protein C
VSAAALVALAAGALVPWALADLAAYAPRGRRALLVPLLAGVGRRLGAPAAPRDLPARIAAAGLRAQPGDVMAIKAGTALAALLVAFAPASALPGRLGPCALVCAPLGGFLAPDLHLRRRSRGRAARMATELADTLDLLRVAVEAGLAPARALAEVGRRHRGLLAAELRATAARLALGVPRHDAFATLAARCPLAPVAALVAALDRAERHGAPLAPALAALSTDARADRARAMRDRAARAAPKIQLVIALLLVPAVLLLVAAALAGALVR